MTAVDRSLAFAQYPQLHPIVAFATETPQWRLVACKGGATELQLFIESVQGGLKRGCESVWRSIRQDASDLEPKIEALELIDEATTQVIGTGSAGFIPQAKRRELWVPIVIAAVTVATVLAAGGSGDAVQGAV